MADGYARASGKVGVAIATSGPGATNMVTGIATAMMDSSPIVCITGQVGSKLIGSDAFQETDITGITLPITKHNYLVTRAEDVAPAVREAFAVARSRAARPGAGRHHQGRAAGQLRVRLGRRRAAPRPRPYDDALPGDGDLRDALDADQRRRAAADSRRPRRHAVGRRARRSCALAERAQIPVAVTLLGIGGVPASHPLNLGMMGMHGEAWVNHAIQEADLLIALGMRFDDRVTGNLKTYAPNAKKIHVDIDPRRAEQERPRRRRDRQRPARRRSTSGCRTSRRATASPWLAHIDALKGDSAVRDIQNLPDDGHLYAAHVINDLWRLTEGRRARRHRRRPAPDVGGAVLQARPAALAHHLGRPRHDGLRAAGGDRREDRAPRRRGLGRRRRRRLPDDDARAGDASRRRSSTSTSRSSTTATSAWSGSGRSSSTTSATPRRRSAGPDFAKLAEAFGIARDDGDPARGRRAARSRRARRLKRAALIDFQVEQEDSVYPMVPAGADLHKMIRRPSPLVETAAD